MAPTPVAGQSAVIITTPVRSAGSSTPVRSHGSASGRGGNSNVPGADEVAGAVMGEHNGNDNNGNNGNGRGHGVAGDLCSAIEAAIDCAENGASNFGHSRGHRNDLTRQIPGGQAAQLTSLLPGLVSPLNLVINVQQQTQLTLFSAANQVLQGARGQIIGGDPGSIISQDNNTIILHKGRLAVGSGEDNSVVKTSAGEVKLNPGTVAIIDDQAGKPLHVVALAGRGETVFVSGPVTHGAIVSACAGQELIISELGISEEELIPAEGTETVISGGVEKRANVVRSKISIDAVVEQQRNRAGRFARLSKLAPGNLSDGTTAIARRPFSGNVWELFDTDKQAVPANIVAQPGCQIQQDESGNIKLLSGSLFISSRAHNSLSTRFANVEIRKNGCAMIEVDERYFRAKSLSGPGDLKINSTDRAFELSPGQELLISSSAPSKTDIIPADAIARRVRTQTQEINGLHFTINDFSITTMLRYAGYRNMIAASDKSGKLVDKILKTAVVVELVTRGYGKYAYSPLYSQDAISGQKLSNAVVSQ